MALVTVQRSPSVTGSPQCSNSDSEADEEEGSKQEKSECFFAGKGTALVLALKDIPQYSERRLSTDSIRSTNSTQSNNSDIQHHLQSMFYLLRHEETLKMAVKLESQRANRTRYIVIASRCCYRSTTTERRNKITRHNSARMSSSSCLLSSATGTASTVSAASTAGGLGTARQLSMDSSRVSTQQQLQQIDDSWVEMRNKRLSNSTTTNRQSLKCDVSAKLCASGDSKNSNALTQNSTANTNIMISLNSATQENVSNQDYVGVEESCLLGIDYNERATIGLVVPILADTTIHLDGDGGFSVSVYGKTHIFKPVSVQAMWSALQTLHKVSQKARENNFYPGGPSHDWLSFYESRIESEQSCLNEWNAMDSLESRRPPSPDAIRNKPTAKEETEGVIKMKLKEIMMSVDLDEVTSKYIRSRLEEHLDMDLGEYKSFIDEEMLMILGQMDAPTEIFDHVYLGSEWNASNLEELQKNGVRHILNVTREIDNFFPGMFDYLNIRVYDDEKTNLLKHWDNTFRYITRAKAEGSKVLVHCKMGVSRSASVVIAYAMKAYNWEFQKALQHVKERRSCIKPNKNFLNQLETYRGMLDAMKNKEKLQRSKSETNLKSTKDARLLPGSEPTPLIQALNQSKSKSGGDSNDVEVNVSVAALDPMAVPAMVTLARPTVRGEHKNRRLLRRSSSTSPRTIQTPISSIIVMKQQSQSLENLTPDRSIAEEPKNMRFPGSNGENYSVTQNQVLHIQKHTPPSDAASMTQRKTMVLVNEVQKMHTSPPAATSVRTIVHDLENHQINDPNRKVTEDRKSLSLPFGKTAEDDDYAKIAEVPQSSASGSGSGSETTTVTKMGSPVWTSSSKLITQTSNINSSTSLNREEAIQKRQHNRKTQSWAATSGGIIMDTSALGSNSSIDSISTQTSAPAAISTAPAYESIVKTRSRQRELPSRHASWGSGDNRCGMPIRNSSWGAFDTNRNSCQYNFNQHANANAIFEGQIHELSTSDKTVSAEFRTTQQQLPHHFGTVKRTKQKLEESTNLKKLCQENGTEAESPTTINAADEGLESFHPKRSSNLFRSASAAAGTRTRFAQRCNSEEIVPSSGGGIGVCSGGVMFQTTQLSPGRRSEGSRCATSDLFSVSAPEAYTMSDIENKNTVSGSGSDEENVILRSDIQAAVMATTEDQRVSGNVQILKKNFEAKAGGAAIPGSHSGISNQTPVNPTTGNLATNKPSKGHQSLPSSPVAQHHVDHQHNQQIHMKPQFLEQSLTSNQAHANMTTSLSSDQTDRNVKGLVHKYQTSSSTSANMPTKLTIQHQPPSSTTANSAIYKPRPRSYYEQQRSMSGKPHEFSESRPPPAPQKVATLNASHHLTEGILTQQQQQPPQQRRLQQHGKTHPLARLSLPKQSFNAAAYNTIFFRMLRSVKYSFDYTNIICYCNDHTNSQQ
ncbi:protein phosphatase Slingshot [Stomoxys calcitrans]|uniref:protein-serine/threonine phosphatase n=1 Tax=Stomoxys calcitrans TaxID=35570 RepID=A0A1I8Q8Y5_STOCA|nr:protein phosphatase Slingshot [Stomoxys calcitrans]